MQLAERYAHERRNLSWSAAAELFTLILAALLVVGMILTILYLLAQRDRHAPSIDDRPSESANVQGAHFQRRLPKALNTDVEYIRGGAISNS